MSCIKSIQRGYVGIQPGETVTVSISTVDVTKTIILLNCDGPWNYYQSSYSTCPTQTASYVTELTAISFKIFSHKFGSGQIGGTVSWQVIEFA